MRSLCLHYDTTTAVIIPTMAHYYEPALRLEGFDKPRVWSVLTPLAQELKAANLVQLA